MHRGLRVEPGLVGGASAETGKRRVALFAEMWPSVLGLRAARPSPQSAPAENKEGDPKAANSRQ